MPGRMPPFDATAYRQRVLAPLAAATEVSFDDPFLLIDLDPAVDDETVIRERLIQVVAFWRRERSPKYKALTGALVNHRGRLEQTLLDPVARRSAAAHARASRAAADAERFGALDALAARLVARFNGLPRSRVGQFASLARAKGLDDDKFTSWLAQHDVVEDTNATEPLPTSIRRQIRAALDEYARVADAADRSATLWTFLGLAPTANTAEVVRAHADLFAENQRRGHDQQHTVTANLLAHVKNQLLGATRDAYIAGLITDAKETLTAAVTEKVILDGELSSEDFELLVRRAIGLGYGLTTDQARAAIRAAATALGASLSTGPAIDYVLCPTCREAQPTGTSAKCRYCGTELWLDCRSCGSTVEAAAAACEHCGISLRVARELDEALTLARTSLHNGQPKKACATLASVLTAAQSVPLLTRTHADLAAEADRVLASAADEWRSVHTDLADKRLYTALDRLIRLSRVADDVPGPDGTTITHFLADLAERKAAISGQVTAGRALPPIEREAALDAILAVAADCPEALGLLATLPLPSPQGLTATLVAGAIDLVWQPVKARGVVHYRVTRRLADPRTDLAEIREFGPVQNTSWRDGGVTGGTLVEYKVVAASDPRVSPPSYTAPLRVLHDIVNLTARRCGEAIELTWIVPPVLGNVIIDRIVVPASEPWVPLHGVPHDVHRHLDLDVHAGIDYRYRIRVEYTDANGRPEPTTGAVISCRITPRPHPVLDLEFHTTDGQTHLTWTPPPAGEVRIYAAAAPLAPPGADVEVGEIAQRGRFVGTGQGRTADPHPQGQVVYTAITIDDDRAVAGQSAADPAAPAIPYTSPDRHPFTGLPENPLVTTGPAPRRRGSDPLRWYYFVTILSAGFLTAIPFIHAAYRLHRRTTWLLAGGYVALSASCVVLIPLIGKPEGTIENALYILTSGLWLMTIVGGWIQLPRLRREVYGLPAPRGRLRWYWYYALVALSFGFLASVPFIHAADRIGRRGPRLLAGVYFVLNILVIILPGVSQGIFAAWVRFAIWVTMIIGVFLRLPRLRREVFALSTPG